MKNCKGCYEKIKEAFDWCIRCESVRDDLMMGHTRKELTEAFGLVKNPNHWKDKIDAYCNEDQIGVVSDAIVFFTGSIPYFYRVGRTKRHRVVAEGYWEAMGA